MMKKLFAIWLVLLLSAMPAFAQSSPGFYLGFVPTAAQWNSYFAGKQDALGFSPINPSGGTMTGRFVTAAPTATLGGFNVTPGSTPSAPANGDIWATSSGMFGRVGGATYKLNVNPGSVVITAAGVNFNLAGDTIIPLALPTGFTRYVVSSIRISNASHTLTTATAGVFTGAAGGGVAVVTAASAITVSATADATNNNAMAFTINNANTINFLLASQPSLYLKIATPEGAAATGDVTVILVPLP